MTNPLICPECAEPLSDLDVIVAESLGFFPPIHWHHQPESVISRFKEWRDEDRASRDRLPKDDPERTCLGQRADELDAVIRLWREALRWAAIARTAEKPENAAKAREQAERSLRELAETFGSLTPPVAGGKRDLRAVLREDDS